LLQPLGQDDVDQVADLAALVFGGLGQRILDGRGHADGEKGVSVLAHAVQCMTASYREQWGRSRPPPRCRSWSARARGWRDERDPEAAWCRRWSGHRGALLVLGGQRRRQLGDEQVERLAGVDAGERVRRGRGGDGQRLARLGVERGQDGAARLGAARLLALPRCGKLSRRTSPLCFSLRPLSKRIEPLPRSKVPTRKLM